MTIKEFAFLNCINEKEANRILNWFLENFDEKDIGKLADILVDAVKKSAAIIHDFQNACLEIKEITPDYSNINILEYVKMLVNLGMRASRAGEELAETIKRIQKNEKLKKEI